MSRDPGNTYQYTYCQRYFMVCYLIWGYFKGRVYSPLPKTLYNLKTNIEREITKISTRKLQKLFLKILKNMCISAEGGNFENK